MQHDHHMKKLAILYFEGKATDEEELRLLEFIKESARNHATKRNSRNGRRNGHIRTRPTRGPRLRGRS